MASIVEYPSDGFDVRIERDGRWRLGPHGTFEEATRPNDNSSAASAPELGLAKTESVSVVVLVTEHCNLRCSYCKFDNLITAPNKTRTDAEGILAAIDKFAKDYRDVQISFLGGEPMVAWREIRSICSTIRNRHSNVQFNLTTNGTIMSREILDFLLDNNVIVAVSLDGTQELHDRNRYSVSGKLSHNLAIKSYEMLKQAGVECGPVSVVLEPERLCETFWYFYDNFGDRRIYLKPINGSEDQTLEETAQYNLRLVEAQFELLEQLMSHYQKTSEKLTEVFVDDKVSHIVLAGAAQTKFCTKTPSCGLGNEVQGLDAAGNVLPCHELKKFSNVDEEFIRGIKTRGGYCDGCSQASICTSFCMAQFSSEYISEYLSGGCHARLDSLCNYNKEFARRFFSMMYRDKEPVLQYLGAPTL